MPDQAALSGRLALLWSVLHEGGIAIDTPPGQPPDASILLRTVVQLDGDCLVMADSAALLALPRRDLLRLLVRHRAAVRAARRQMAESLGLLPRLLRAALPTALAAAEIAPLETLFTHASSHLDTMLSGPDWQALLSGQVPALAVVGTRLIAPALARLVAPLATGALQAGRRAASEYAYAELRRRLAGGTA